MFRLQSKKASDRQMLIYIVGTDLELIKIFWCHEKIREKSHEWKCEIETKNHEHQKKKPKKKTRNVSNNKNDDDDVDA